MTETIKKFKTDYSYNPKTPGSSATYEKYLKQVKNINNYASIDKMLFEIQNSKDKIIVDHIYRVATLGMEFTSILDGIGNYIGNNLITISALFGQEDAMIEQLDKVHEGWGSLFQDEGILNLMNDISFVKYDDLAWQFGSQVGQVAGIGTGRYLCSLIPIPGLGEVLANVFTFGSGYGEMYKNQRKEGKTVEESRIYGGIYGAIETVTFGFEGIGVNALVGFLTPFAETMVETLADPSDESFVEKGSKTFEEKGGIAGVIISTLLYALNGKMHLKVKQHDEMTDAIVKDIVDATKEYEKLSDTDKFLASPYITTVVNTILSSLFGNIDWNTTPT